MSTNRSDHDDQIGEPMPLTTQITDPATSAAQKVRGRYLVLLICGVAAAALVAACSGGSSGGSSGSTPSSSPSGATSGVGNRSGGGPAGPAASGLIAAVQPGSIEVQSTTAGQLTVAYTASTRITQTVTGSLADITVGSCIVAIDTSAATSSTSTATSTAPTTITVSPAVSGSCTRAGGFGGGGFGGGGFGGGARPSGSFTPGATRPSGFPSGARSGFPGGGNFANAITTGKVTAVSGSTITVAAESFARTGASTSPSATPTTTSKTITVTSATKITKTAAVTSTALKVGLCASAQGSTDTTGTVAATSIAITSPDSSGSCEATGFGGRFSRGGAGGAGASGSNG